MVQEAVSVVVLTVAEQPLMSVPLSWNATVPLGFPHRGSAPRIGGDSHGLAEGRRSGDGARLVAVLAFETARQARGW